MQLRVFELPSPIDSRIEAIVQAANKIDPMQGGQLEDQLYNDVDWLSGLDAGTRVRALIAIKNVRDLVTRTSIALRLLEGRTPGIYHEALEALSRSDDIEDKFLLLQISFRIGEHIDRASLKRGLVRAWRKSSGNARASFAKELEKRRFRKVLGLWL